MTGVHHTAIVTADVARSRRFWCDGLGFTELFDHTFTGDWPTLFNARTDRLRSVFLGDPDTPDTGIIELVEFHRGREEQEINRGREEQEINRGREEQEINRGREEQEITTAEVAPWAPDAPTFGFFLVSVQRDVDATLAGLAALGFNDGVRRIAMPAPGGKTVAMAVITAPDGVCVELIGPPA
ncbi:MAG: hypothetical protein NVS4B6_04430 [Mycobacterium sp.]